MKLVKVNRYKVQNTAALREAKQSQNDLLISLGIDPFRKINPANFRGYFGSVSEAVITPSCHGGISGSIPLQTAKNGATKPVKNYKLEQSKRFTIAPAYNKGGYQVIGKNDIRDIGR